MLGVEIHDLDPEGFLAFDLKEILCCLGDDAMDRMWQCTCIEAVGEATPELEAAEATGELLPGERLLALAERTKQVIWGDFLGRRPGESSESLQVSAFDSMFWTVHGDSSCIDKVRAAFSDVRPAEDADAAVASRRGPPR